ncbi:MAG: hypothetical protein H7X91_11680 [Burkholderiales bacterium]|nr:hypothetical protein [Burkholderiales bacterium]
MNNGLWVLLALLAIIAIGFALMMRRLMRQSREAERNIDHSKLRHIEDEQ